MAMHGRGLICIAMTGERLDELELAQMSSENTALGGTAFTVSVDVKGPDVTTGISASDRAQTILAVTEASSRPDDFARPGHVFPLRAATGGVLERRGPNGGRSGHGESCGTLSRRCDLRDRE